LSDVSRFPEGIYTLGTTTEPKPVGTIRVATDGIYVGQLVQSQDAVIPNWTPVGGGGGFADPMTTRGDMIYRDNTNTTARLPVGANGQVITTDGVDVFWGAGGGGLSPTLGVTTSVNLALGDVVALDNSAPSELVLADPSTGLSPDRYNAKGIASAAALAGTTANIYSIPGQQVPVRFTSAPAAASNGSRVYLSTTAGAATLTPPGTGNAVVLLGILVGADGVTLTPDVLTDFSVIAIIS
jgi:hypothetical protein